jgi:hypothetical protein
VKREGERDGWADLSSIKPWLVFKLKPSFALQGKSGRRREREGDGGGGGSEGREKERGKDRRAGCHEWMEGGEEEEG